MDAVLFIIIALVLVLVSPKEVETSSAEIKCEKEDLTRTAKLNDNYYEDPNAFSEIINALGFPKGR